MIFTFFIIISKLQRSHSVVYVMYIGSNDLSGTIPDEMANITQLQYFSLGEYILSRGFDPM